MSFILDALKKLERGSQTAGSDADGVRMEGGRRWGESQRGLRLAIVAVMVVAVAALSVAGMALLRSFQSDRANGPPAEAAGGSMEPGPERGATAPPHSRPPTPLSTAGTPPRVNESRVASELPAPTAPPGEVPGEQTTSESSLDPEPPLEPAHPVRLVGRDAEPREPPPAVSEGASTEQTLEGIPAGAPNLTLQGTSIIGDQPVAVVNYQRVFEGDVVDGVRVIEIRERAVLLEFEGARFLVEL